MIVKLAYLAKTLLQNNMSLEILNNRSFERITGTSMKIIGLVNAIINRIIKPSKAVMWSLL